MDPEYDTVKDDIKNKLALAPLKPGVYLMKNDRHKVIYVGKAKNLRHRLKSYFVNAGHDLKTSVLVGKIYSFDTIITTSEQEALILESNLITQYKPKYNVILKDDKKYPSLRIHPKEDYPVISVVRKIKNDGAMYFGPFSSGNAVKQTLRFINKTFALRKCQKKAFMNRSRPCLNYQIDACLAPCCLDVDQDRYHAIVHEVSLFLKGRTPQLIKKIEAEMKQAAAEQRYEDAAGLRDKLFAVNKILEKQIVISKDHTDRDVIGFAAAQDIKMITLFKVRNGFLIGSRHFDVSDAIDDDHRTLESFILQYYTKQNDDAVPAEVLVPKVTMEKDAIETFLSDKKGLRVKVIMPERGEKKKILSLACTNAAEEIAEKIKRRDSARDLLARLQKRIGMAAVPERIECFDNSNISGTDPVAGMVVFVGAVPDKSAYRRYKIKTVEGHDDYAYMKEILYRRFTGSGKDAPLPDLLMVDGGKGQLNIAVGVLEEIGMNGLFQVVGIAKKDENRGETTDKIYKPGRSNPLNFGKDADALLFLQRIRDEAHRFAITFHRERRSKRLLVSELDAIEGIGDARKKALFKKYGSIAAIANASVADLSAVDGMTIQAAKAIHKSFSHCKG